MTRSTCCLLGLVCLLGSTRGPVWAESKVIYTENSPYQYIAVIENTEKGERYISNQNKGLFQGGIAMADPDRLLFEYTRMSFLGLAFVERTPETVLFIGLGAGAMPRYMNKVLPQADIDVVEIDPAIMAVAQRYFHFQETPRMKVHIQDGRVFLRRTKQQYDMIFLDAYQGGMIPFHLTTREFMTEVRRHLKPGGVVVSNILSPFKNKFFTSMIETFLEEFPGLHIVRGEASDNYIFIADDHKECLPMEDVTARARTVERSLSVGIDLGRVSWKCACCTDFREPGAKVLTDDFAPADLYQHMKAGGQ